MTLSSEKKNSNRDPGIGCYRFFSIWIIRCLWSVFKVNSQPSVRLCNARSTFNGHWTDMKVKKYCVENFSLYKWIRKDIVKKNTLEEVGVSIITLYFKVSSAVNKKQVSNYFKVCSITLKNFGSTTQIMRLFNLRSKNDI
jgi:hypothetical protein